MKLFFKPTIKKVISTIILFFVIPMFGAVQSFCFDIPCPKAYFGFVGTPVFYIAGGLIDIIESWGRIARYGSYGLFNAQVSEYLHILLYLLPYLLVSYLIVCIIVYIFRKK